MNKSGCDCQQNDGTLNGRYSTFQKRRDIYQLNIYNTIKYNSSKVI